jgi:hypothetical protein
MQKKKIERERDNKERKNKNKSYSQKIKHAKKRSYVWESEEKLVRKLSIVLNIG